MFRIRYYEPFYYLQEKGKIFWIFNWWNTLEFSQNLEYIEEKYSNLNNK